MIEVVLLICTFLHFKGRNVLKTMKKAWLVYTNAFLQSPEAKS